MCGVNMEARMGQLTRSENAKLSQCEEIIERGERIFIEVGRALLQIREEQLYLGSSDTFEGYVKARWGKSRSWAYRQISAMEAVLDVCPENHR